MQIDFHHGTVYVLARIAGFPKEDSENLAYASQYVDDAVQGGLIHFDNGAVFRRTLTAHRTLDFRNLDLSDNLDIWMPFHFLPGNVKDNPKSKSFIQRLLTRSNSSIARKMVGEATGQSHKPYGLHRFGITLHVYADTWAHQGFAGVINQINEAEDPKEIQSRKEVSWAEKVWESLKVGVNDILDDVSPPIGHGRVSVLPDLPYANWSYTDGTGRRHFHKNWEGFREAAEYILKSMRTYLVVIGLQPTDNAFDAENLNKIENIFEQTTDEDGEKRHGKWLEAISNGTFRIDGGNMHDEITYAQKGKESWEYKAIGQIDHNTNCYRFHEGFLKSDWKHFHDAAMAHRFYVLHELLPENGICAG